MTTLYLQALSATSIASSLQISEPFLVIAGYTGRNAYAVNQHIIELQAHGITPPEMIPMFWTLPNWLLSVAQPAIQVHAGKSSGEAEPVLIRMPNGELFVTVGSDHTDRSLELFLGTIPLQTRSFCFAKRFLAILEDRERGRNLRCDSAIDDLSSMALG